MIRIESFRHLDLLRREGVQLGQQYEGLEPPAREGVRNSSQVIDVPFEFLRVYRTLILAFTKDDRGLPRVGSRNDPDNVHLTFVLRLSFPGEVQRWGIRPITESAAQSGVKLLQCQRHWYRTLCVAFSAHHARASVMPFSADQLAGRIVFVAT